MSLFRTPRARIGLLLAVVTLAAFWPVLDNGFTNYDDDDYVTDNPRVLAGPTFGGIAWAFTTTDAANWHPLTWVSHMLDCLLFGMDPRGHHLTSLLIHAASAVLLFLVFERMTGSIRKSAAVAALFALHPLHVESVAWVSERKDVLGGLFWMLTLAAYSRCVSAPSPLRKGAVLATFALGLLAKPMLVTLPFVLLLLDFWPLRRIDRGWRLVTEKAPLFLLAVASSVITLVAQHRGGALSSLARYPFRVRVANAVVAYVVYLRKALWPADLAVLYPHPGNDLRTWQIAGAALLVLAITAVALRARRRLPYLSVGWLWYLGTLVPVLGLVQVGEQALADRYTYLPLVGIFVIAAWGVPDAIGAIHRAPPGRTLDRLLLTGGLVVLLALAVVTRAQTRVWHDSVRLFSHALAVTDSNQLAHINLGRALEDQGDLSGAEAQYRRAVALRADDALARNNLGHVLHRQGKFKEAIAQCQAALRVDPDYAQAHSNLGIALAGEGRIDDAVAHFDRATRLRPNDSQPHYNWGAALAMGKRWGESVVHFREAIRLWPEYAEAHYGLGMAMYSAGEIEAARREVDLARRLGYQPPPEVVRRLSLP